MPELHLRQVGFTYSAHGQFTKHRERIQSFRETGNLNRHSSIKHLVWLNVPLRTKWS